MGLPNINIIFQKAANTAILRGDRGIVALILKDSVNLGLHTYLSLTDVPDNFSDYNKDQISLAFMGGTNTPMKVIVFVEGSEATDNTDAMNALETVKWNYLALPGATNADVTAISNWIKALRDNKDLRVKAVLPNIVADHEGIINFATDDIKVGATKYTAANYCSRIAGLLAGTPLTQSATYQVLKEVDDVPHLSIADFNTAIDAGKCVLMNDGEKVKVARAVNSLVTISPNKGNDYKKIKLVDVMDQIHDDIKRTIADNYIGKFPNDYDNQVLLITALLGYAKSLEDQSLLNSGSSSFGVDIKAKKSYLNKLGIDVTTIKDQALKEYPTGDKVFISGNIKILDAMEDFNLSIGM